MKNCPWAMTFSDAANLVQNAFHEYFDSFSNDMHMACKPHSVRMLRGTSA